MYRFWVSMCVCAVGFVPLHAQRFIDMSAYGVRPDTKADMSVKIQKALAVIRKNTKDGDSIVLNFRPGEYHFHSKKATKKTYYVSNHDQPNPKNIGLALEGMSHMRLEGNGARFVFHGRMLPLALVRSRNCTLSNLSIDFADPQIAQVQVVKNEGDKGITFRVEPWVKYRIKDSYFETYGEGWSLRTVTGIAFEEKTRHIVYNTSDVAFHSEGAVEKEKGLVHAPNFRNKALVPGTVVALRAWVRSEPGIFLAENTNTSVENVTVHYAEGMGLIAQRCENISLDGFRVCLKGNNDPRNFTTQADATHFSQCKGLIKSVNGLYEGMMDDAINVHGVYLNIVKIVDQQTVRARFMHDQAWGFSWGEAGDSVQFIASKTMEAAGSNVIESIQPVDGMQGTGMKEFTITFKQPLDQSADMPANSLLKSLSTLDLSKTPIGMEDLNWTPEVYFAHNTVRNNRARGALFSSMRKTVVEDNLFDHTSGSAILLCGDCNGWYESGPCRDILIQNNTFVNALTNMFQFTNAVISIYPEIPDIEHQTRYYHGGKENAIRILNNTFRTFDQPVLYAKSVDGLLFKGNKIEKTNDYAPFHWNKDQILLEHTSRVRIDR